MKESAHLLGLWPDASLNIDDSSAASHLDCES